MSSKIPAAEDDGIDPGLIACGIETAEKITDRPRPRIRRAIKNGELVARRDGRRLIIEVDELRRWIHSLPLACASSHGEGEDHRSYRQSTA
jgi:hypothetical protein